MRMTERDIDGGAGGSGGSGERLIRVGSRLHVWIKDGVLYLPGEVLHPLILLTCGRRLHIITTAQGRKLTFIRAADVVAEAPQMAGDVQKVAARFGCSL